MLGQQLEDGTFPQRVSSDNPAEPVHCWTDLSHNNDDKQLDQTAAMLKLSCSLSGIYNDDKVYLRQIRMMEDALLKYKDKKCYNLWEERRGHDSYTTCQIIDGCYEAMLFENYIDNTKRDSARVSKLEKYMLELVESLGLFLVDVSGNKLIQSTINWCPDSRQKRSYITDFFDSSTFMALVYSKWKNKTILSVRSPVSFDNFYDVYDYLAGGFRVRYPLNKDSSLYPYDGGVFMGRALQDGYDGIKAEANPDKGNPWIIPTADSVGLHLMKGDYDLADANLKLVLDYGRRCNYKYPEQIDKVTGEVKEGMPLNLTWSNASVGNAINAVLNVSFSSFSGK